MLKLLSLEERVKAHDESGGSSSCVGTTLAHLRIARIRFATLAQGTGLRRGLDYPTLSPKEEDKGGAPT